MNKFYPDPNYTQPPEHQRGMSSIAGTEQLRSNLMQLFKKYSIHSLFDAGCNDCAWSYLIAAQIDYKGTDINQKMIDDAKLLRPELDITCSDIRVDPMPIVDCVLIRDVTIHFNTKEKKQVLENFKKSQSVWLLITHIPYCNKNEELPNLHPIDTVDVNWQLPPWNFPPPRDVVYEYGADGRCLALWHKEQIENLI